MSAALTQVAQSRRFATAMFSWRFDACFGR